MVFTQILLGIYFVYNADSYNKAYVRIFWNVIPILILGLMIIISMHEAWTVSYTHLFPVQAMANLYEMYYAQAMNHKLYKENNPQANE